MLQTDEMKIKSRPYQVEADDQRIRALLSQNYATVQHPYYSADPPNWERISASAKTGSNKQTIHLWELAERPTPKLIGIVLYQPHQGAFSYLVHPHYEDIDELMVNWVEDAHQTQQAPLTCSVCEENERQTALLSRRGYVKGKLGPVFRQRQLDTVFPEHILPHSYRMQEVHTLTKTEFAERAQVESDVFGSSVTAAFLRALSTAPLYRPALDLVVLAENGRIAAFCTVWFDESHRVGFYEPIGTAAAHRRLGLGKALMIEGMRRLHKLGATTAYLGHSAENSAGHRLYNSVGMSLFDREYEWQLQR